MLITRVELSKTCMKTFDKIPRHIREQFMFWVRDVENRGLAEVRKIPGYHDEPLWGALEGLRSIRLNRGYRAYYRILGDSVKVVRVERIDKHEY